MTGPRPFFAPRRRAEAEAERAEIMRKIHALKLAFSASAGAHVVAIELDTPSDGDKLRDLFPDMAMVSEGIMVEGSLCDLVIRWPGRFAG